MKYLFLFLVFSFFQQSQAHAGCENVSEETYKKIMERFILQGKGSIEVNQIMKTRVMFCKGQCIENGQLCMLVEEKDKQ